MFYTSLVLSGRARSVYLPISVACISTDDTSSFIWLLKGRASAIHTSMERLSHPLLKLNNWLLYSCNYRISHRYLKHFHALNVTCLKHFKVWIPSFWSFSGFESHVSIEFHIWNVIFLKYFTFWTRFWNDSYLNIRYLCFWNIFVTFLKHSMFWTSRFWNIL